MAVIGIIAVLITIVVVAAGGAIKTARQRRAETMRVGLEQGINAYYAQMGEWPERIESRTSDDEESIIFTGTEADAIFREVVGKGFGKSKGGKTVLVDASALFVCSASRAGNPLAVGTDFPLAANRNSKYHIPFASMAFGYPETERGRFRRYRVKYISKADSVVVLLSDEDEKRKKQEEE